MQGEAKEEVRARLNIEDVIGDYVQLRRAGRNFKGLSPFSGEKTPSFFVSPDKQIWHDFSANKGGDVFSFVMEAEGMDFRQALEHLARKAGVDLSQYQSGSNRRIAEQKKRMLAAHALAVRYYQASLVSTRRALEYTFATRHLSKDVVKDFAIGYAPDTGDALVRFLQKRGFTREELAKSGLLNRYGGDLFRGRMMVPLQDPGGQVIGFTGRIIGDVEHAPKYLNTPQTLLYDKGRHVFGLSQAKDAIRRCNYVVIVEGNLDVVSSHQVGVRQVVATAGTALSEQHLKALARLTSDIRLCFDGDQAGIAATERAIGIGTHVGVDLSIVSLPDSAKDPDELIQQSVDAWQRAVETPRVAVDWVIEQYAAREDLSSAKGKRAFTSAALALVARLDDSVERDHYEELIAAKIGSTRASIRDKAERLAAEPARRLRRIASSDGETNAVDAYEFEDDLLALCIAHPSQRSLLAAIEAAWWHSEARAQLAAQLIAQPEALDYDDHDYLAQLELRAETQFGAWQPDDRTLHISRLIRRVEYEHNRARQQSLLEELRRAEDDDDARAATLRQELNELIKILARKW